MFVRNGFEKKVAAACSHILADEILPERERFLLTNTYTLQTYFNSLGVHDTTSGIKSLLRNGKRYEFSGFYDFFCYNDKKPARGSREGEQL